MTELQHCPRCGARSPPERYERSKGFHRFRVGCPHYSVTGRTSESAERAWNRLMERENRRCQNELVRKQGIREREEARAWRPVVTEPLPCPICGNLPHIRYMFDRPWSMDLDKGSMSCRCHTCNYGAPSAPSKSMAIERWNEYVKRQYPGAKA